MQELRLLTVADAAAFVDLRQLAVQSDPEAFSIRRSTDSNSRLEIVQQRLSARTIDDGPLVVGAFDVNLIGVIGLIRPPAAYPQIWGLYVDPRCRRRGVGRTLLARALEIARSIPNVERLGLEVSEKSIPAIRLYESVGFRHANAQSKAGIREMVLQLV